MTVPIDWKKRCAALEAALKGTLHILKEKQDNGKPQPATARAAMARVLVERSLDGGTWALDKFLAEASRAGFEAAKANSIGAPP